MNMLPGELPKLKECQANGQHDFGVSYEELLKINGRTSFSCKNCGFLMVWDSNLKINEQR